MPIDARHFIRAQCADRQIFCPYCLYPAMNELTHYDFRIDAWSPETLPMVRLAKYLAKLSAMFGYEEHVHFLKVRKGSAIPEIAVDNEAALKIAARFRLVGTPGIGAYLSGNKPYAKR